MDLSAGRLGWRWRPRAPRRAERGFDALRDRLGDRRRYEQRIDRLHLRHLGDGGLWTITEGDVSLGSVVMQRDRVARILARAVTRGEYELRPGWLKRVRADDKDRMVFRYSLFDTIVHGVVADIVDELIEPHLSPNLYSYRRGVSWLDGVMAFGRYARAHHRARPDPRERGLYVLRRDISAYTDSIPVGPGSAIWSQLAEALGIEPRVLVDEPQPWPVVRDVVRPRVLRDDGTVRALEVGVATGQPIASVAFNLYLSGVDHEMSAVPGGFYARYSDDLLFAHPDPAVVREASGRLEDAVHGLRLELKSEKRRDLYLTGAGRASAAWPAATGTQHVPFLGMRVALDGTVGLGGRKMRRFLREARRRSRNAARASLRGSQDARGRAVVAALDGLLDTHDAILQGQPATILAAAVTDRDQLDWLDHELARIVAAAVSGDRRAAAFRRVPYRRIRSDWGLRSTRRVRDRGGRPGSRRAARPT